MPELNLVRTLSGMAEQLEQFNPEAWATLVRHHVVGGWVSVFAFLAFGTIGFYAVKAVIMKPEWAYRRLDCNTFLLTDLGSLVVYVGLITTGLSFLVLLFYGLPHLLSPEYYATIDFIRDFS